MNPRTRMKSRSSILSFLLAIVAITLLTVVSGYGATVEDVVKTIRSLPPAQRKTVLEEGERKEGESVWYTSMGLADFPKILGAFEKAFPFIKVKATRLTQSSIFTKIDTEARAGRVVVDVVASAPVEIWELREKGYSAPYLSPELKAFPAGSYDAQGFWSSYEVTPIVVRLVAPPLVSTD